MKIGSNTWDGETKKTYRAAFRHNQTSYILQLTDPVAIHAFEEEAEGDYPLNDAYARDNNRCHKLVAAIIKDPAL